MRSGNFQVQEHLLIATARTKVSCLQSFLEMTLFINAFEQVNAPAIFQRINRTTVLHTSTSPLWTCGPRCPPVPTRVDTSHRSWMSFVNLRVGMPVQCRFMFWHQVDDHRVQDVSLTPHHPAPFWRCWWSAHRRGAMGPRRCGWKESHGILKSGRNVFHGWSLVYWVLEYQGANLHTVLCRFQGKGITIDASTPSDIIFETQGCVNVPWSNRFKLIWSGQYQAALFWLDIWGNMHTYIQCLQAQAQAGLEYAIGGLPGWCPGQVWILWSQVFLNQ